MTAPPPIGQDGALSEVRSVSKIYAPSRGTAGMRAGRQPITAVDDVSLKIKTGHIVGLVGASGSGKSTLSEIILGLIPPSAGSVLWRGNEVAHLGRRALKEFRINAQMVFQDPFGSLNPRMSVRQSVAEPAQAAGVKRADLADRVALALTRAGHTPRPELLRRYPHQLSGGELQRVAIARAIVMEPVFLAADEPVSMLDASVQSGILNLLLHLREELNLTILYVSHDLATVRYVCNEVAVMQAGRIVEQGSAEQVLLRPEHDYTRALLDATPGRRRSYSGGMGSP